MAVKFFKSDQTLDTAANAVITTSFSDKSTLSWSFFLKSLQDVSGSTSNFLGGQFSRFFFMNRPVTTSPNVRFTVVTSGSNTNSSSFYVSTGVWTHFAATQTPGAQYFYVNGQLLNSGSNPNKMAFVSASTAIGFNRQSASSGHMIFDDFSIFSGIVLSQSQVKSLRNRTILPTDVSLSGNLMYYYTFDNPTGGVIVAGAPGLTNGGFLGSNADLTAVSGQPEWVQETGVFVFNLQPRSIETGKSGKTIIMTFQDMNGNTQDINNADPTQRPTISINGGGNITLHSGILPGGGGTVDLVGGDGYYIVYPVTGVVIQSSDVVKLSTADEGYWSRIDGLGGTDIVVSGSVNNYVGMELYNYAGFSPTGLKIGLNSNFSLYYEEPLFLADISRGGFSALTKTSRPRNISSTSDDALVFHTMDNDYWGRRPHMPSGNATITYYGSGTFDTATITSTGSPNFAVRNINPTGSTNIFFNTVSLPISGVEIYPSGHYGQIFNPRLIQILRDTKCAVYRTMNANQINSSRIASFSEWGDSADQTLGFGFRTQVPLLNITSFVNVSSLLQANRIFMHIFTSGDHGLVNGQVISMTGALTIAITGSATTTTTFPTTLTPVVMVTSPSSLLIQRFKSDGGHVSGVQFFNNTVYCQRENIYRPSLFAKLVNEVPGCDLMYCMPHAMDESGMSLTMHELCQNINTDKKIYLELSNETWNPGDAFQQYGYFYNEGHLNPMFVTPSAYGVTVNTTYIPLTSGVTATGQTRVNLAYAEKAGRLHTIASGVMAQYGLAHNLVRVFGGRNNIIEDGERVLEWARARGYQIDAIATAPYYDNRTDDLYANNFIGLDSEQVQDTLYAALKFAGNRHQQIVNYRNLARTFGARNICYEGGTAGLAVGSSTIVSGIFTLTDVVSIKAGRHPRLADSYFYMLKHLAENGYDLFCHYNIGHSLATEPDNHWGMFQYYTQPIGRGDGSDGLRDSRIDLQDIQHHVSHLGYAMSGWNDGSNYQYRKFILVPSGSQANVNNKLEIMGFGPNNFTIGVLPTGQPNSNPATYYVADISMNDIQWGGTLRPFLITFASGYIESSTSGVTVQNRLGQFLSGQGLKLK
jgi:hypothetical protein